MIHRMTVPKSHFNSAAYRRNFVIKVKKLPQPGDHVVWTRDLTGVAEEVLSMMDGEDLKSILLEGSRDDINDAALNYQLRLLNTHTLALPEKQNLRYTHTSDEIVLPRALQFALTAAILALENMEAHHFEPVYQKNPLKSLQIVVEHIIGHATMHLEPDFQRTNIDSKGDTPQAAFRNAEAVTAIYF